MSAAFRDTVVPDDPARVRALAEATGFFRPEEVAVAVELVDERLARGEASGYRFLFVDAGGELAGYACYGPIPLTATSYDLYWIAVEPGRQGRGLGRALLAETERRIARAGGGRLYVDTSSRPDYLPTRTFYEHCGYGLAARLDDFYAPGDGKAVYCKALASP